MNWLEFDRERRRERLQIFSQQQVIAEATLTGKTRQVLDKARLTMIREVMVNGQWVTDHLWVALPAHKLESGCRFRCRAVVAFYQRSTDASTSYTLSNVRSLEKIG